MAGDIPAFDPNAEYQTVPQAAPSAPSAASAAQVNSTPAVAPAFDPNAAYDTVGQAPPPEAKAPNTLLDAIINPGVNNPVYKYDPLGQMETGATKGVLDAFHTIGHYGSKALQFAGFGNSEIPIQSPEYLQAHGFGENVGKVGEGVAEFFLGDEALKGLSISEKLAEAANVSKTLEKYPRLAAAMQVGIGAMRAGAAQAGQALLHGATPTEAAKSGLMTGATAGVLQGAGATARVAESPVVRALGRGGEVTVVLR